MHSSMALLLCTVYFFVWFVGRFVFVGFLSLLSCLPCFPWQNVQASRYAAMRWCHVAASPFGSKRAKQPADPTSVTRGRGTP